MREAIENLYMAFRRYHSKGTAAPCPCCHDENAGETLQRVPLRQLSNRDLHEFAFDALNVWGSVNDWKHYLPRILELCSLGDLDTDIEIVLSKIGRAKWMEWPAEEQQAMRQFLLAFWRKLLSEFPGVQDVSEVMTGLANIEYDLKPYLAIWLDMLGQQPADKHLMRFIETECNTLRKGRLANAFFEISRRAQANQIYEWLRSDAMVEKVINLDGELVGFVDWMF